MAILAVGGSWLSAGFADWRLAIGLRGRYPVGSLQDEPIAAMFRQFEGTPIRRYAGSGLRF